MFYFVRKRVRGVSVCVLAYLPDICFFFSGTSNTNIYLTVPPHTQNQIELLLFRKL